MMDNIIKFLNFEDDGLEVIDQTEGQRRQTHPHSPEEAGAPFLSRMFLSYALQRHHSQNDQSSCHAGWPPAGAHR